MKKDIGPDDDEMPAEFDFSRSIPNPFWLGMVDRRCVRLLASDLAEAFPTTTPSTKPYVQVFERR